LAELSPNEDVRGAECRRRGRARQLSVRRDSRRREAAAERRRSRRVCATN